jgi:hypothetical protein
MSRFKGEELSSNQGFVLGVGRRFLEEMLRHWYTSSRGFLFHSLMELSSS